MTMEKENVANNAKVSATHAETVETAKTVKTENVKKTDNKTDYAVNYADSYKRMSAAIADIKQCLDSAEVTAKELNEKTETAKDKTVTAAKKANDAADKTLTAEKSKAADAISAVKAVCVKEFEAIDAAKKKELDESATRVKNAKAVESKSKAAVEEDKNKRADAAKATEVDNNKAHTVATANEDKRNKGVIAARAAVVKENENKFNQISDNIKKKFNDDVNALSADIADRQQKYFDAVNAKTKAYNDECAAKKAVFDKTMEEFGQKASSADKAIAKEGKKGMSVTQAAYNKESKTMKSAFDANLAQLKDEFVMSIPPIEHTIFVRTNQNAIDVLKAENDNKKVIAQSSYEEFIEKGNNVINVMTVELNNYSAEEKLACIVKDDAIDYSLGIALADIATEIFNTNELMATTKINLKESLDKKVSDITQKKAIQEQEHAAKIAVINNKFAKLNNDADMRYTNLTAELNAAADSFAGYYATLNKYDGTSTAELAEIIKNVQNACADYAMSDDKAYELYNTAVNVFRNDCTVLGKGVLDDKINALKSNHANTVKLAETRYNNEKAMLKNDFDNETAAENNDHAAKIAALDGEMKAFAGQNAAAVASAEKLCADTLAAIDAKKKALVAKCNAEKEANAKLRDANIRNKENELKKAIEDKKFNEGVQLQNMNNANAALDAKLEALKISIEAEKKGENAKHQKLTDKTIAVLRKNCEIAAGAKWWIVDFSK